MVNAYSRKLALGVDEIATFSNVLVEKGCSASVSGSSTINLNKAGVYLIEFYATSLATNDGNVAFQMLTNGIAKVGDLTTVVGATTATSVSVPVISLVQVAQNDCKCKCTSSPTTIQFQNVGVATTSDVNVVVTKIC